MLRTLIFSLFAISAPLAAETQYQKKLEIHQGDLSPSLMKHLIDVFQTNILIEVGSTGREVTAGGSPLFKDVYAIETSHVDYLKASKRFKTYNNVHTYEGEVKEIFAEISSELKSGRALIWIDVAHFSSEENKDEAIKLIAESIQATKDSKLSSPIFLVSQYPEIANDVREALSISGYQYALMGDLAIAYPESDNVAQSSLVKTCTESGLFTIANIGDVNSVINAEMQLANLQEGQEAKALQTKLTRNQSANQMIWKGLSMMGNKDYSNASRAFHHAISLGEEHWRVHWYIALAEYERKNFSEAKRALMHVKESAPDFKPQEELLAKIQETQ